MSIVVVNGAILLAINFSIHQRCLESIVNKNGAHQFQSMDELEVYMKRAEERVNMEDKELEERKKQYITRSTRKRQRDESGIEHMSGTPLGVRCL